MKALATVFFFLLSICIYCPAAHSQTTTDTLEAAALITPLQRQYAVALPKSPALYNGPEYINYSLRYSARTGHQFFMWPDKQPGSVNYNGQYFSNLLLAYDIVLEQLVLPFPDSPFMLRLVNEHVRDFTINNHHFTRIQTDSTNGSPVVTGYYEILHDGRIQALARRTKRLQKQTRQNKLQVDFPATNKFFLKKNDVYYSVSSKKDILRVFADHTKEMQAYIQRKKLKFKKSQLENSLLELTILYNTLPSA